MRQYAGLWGNGLNLSFIDRKHCGKRRTFVSWDTKHGGKWRKCWLSAFSPFPTMFQEGFLAPLAVGQRAYVMARCPSCVRPCVRPSVRALTFSLNIFFAETTYRILMKFHRNVPTMVLFRIS